MISVPASSANIGPGFDSAGIALSYYLKVQVSEQKYLWEFQHESPLLPSNPIATEHYIYQSAKQVADKHNKVLQPCKVSVESQIPLARGLGSSATAIIAGIELANQVLKLKLSQEKKLQYAIDIEGHPDNVTPSLLGGFTITAMVEGEVKYIKLPTVEMEIVIYIPDYEVTTEEARKAMPVTYSLDTASQANGVSKLMIASLVAGDYELAGDMMEQDIFHEPYRSKLIQNYEFIRKYAKCLGAYGSVISGAGPTMISFVPPSKGKEIACRMRKKINNIEIKTLTFDKIGTQVKILD